MDHPKNLSLFRRQLSAGAGIALAFTLITSVAVPTAAYASPETAATAQTQLDAQRATSTAYSVKQAQDAINALAAVDPEDGMAEGAAQMDVGFAMSKLVSTTPLTNAIAVAESRLGGDVAGASRTWSLTLLDEARSWLASAQNPTVEVDLWTVQTASQDLITSLDSLVDLSVIRAAVSSASALEAGSYSAHSFTRLVAAIAQAQTVVDEYTSTYQEVDWWLNDLNIAVDGLINISGAQSGYDTFLADHKEEDYSARSRLYMQSYMHTALTLLTDAADPQLAVTQGEVNYLAYLRNATFGDMVQISGLRDSVNAAADLNSADYSAASRTAMSIARAVGAAILVRAEDEYDGVGNDEVIDATQALDGFVAGLVNTKALASKYDDADHLVEGDYLAAGWPAFYNAREAAGDLLMDAADFAMTVTDADVTAALSNLTSALAALEGLDGLIAAAEAELALAEAALNRDYTDYTDYTAHSVAQLQSAVDRLTDAVADPVEAELNAASAASATARTSLVNAWSFNYTYDLGVGYDEADFTAASWGPFAVWLATAQPIHDAIGDPTVAVSQATLDASANAGWALMVKLVGTRSLADLRRVVGSYSGLMLTGKSAALIAAALDGADELLARATDSSNVITYAEIYVAIDALHNAYFGLVYTKDAVQTLNNYAEWFDPSNFTASSATALTSALTALNGLAYGDATTTVTAAQLADAVAAVDSAGAVLVSIEWLRNTLGSIDLSEFEADFSASSFGPFAATVAAARAFLARATDPLVTITGAEVDSVTDSLFATSMDLVYVADLHDAVAANAGLVQSKYTAASWAVFAAALADAQAIAARANDGATAAPAGQAEADLAAQALIDAAAALVVAPTLVADPKTATPSRVTAAALPHTGGSDLLVPAGGALALMLVGAGLLAVRRRSEVTDN